MLNETKSVSGDLGSLGEERATDTMEADDSAPSICGTLPSETGSDAGGPCVTEETSSDIIVMLQRTVRGSSEIR